MAKSTKDARNITVNGVPFRWRATGNDGWISVIIWPSEHERSLICCTLPYHLTSILQPDGSPMSAGGQIVVTNRLIRKIIEFAISYRGYDPCAESKDLILRRVDNWVDCTGAILATRGKQTKSN